MSAAWFIELRSIAMIPSLHGRVARATCTIPPMTLNETLKQLKALGDAKVRAQNAKSGAGENQFGVALGDVRKLREIKTNHELARDLWKSGTRKHSPGGAAGRAEERGREWTDGGRSDLGVADWLNSYSLAEPRKETLASG